MHVLYTISASIKYTMMPKFVFVTCIEILKIGEQMIKFIKVRGRAVIPLVRNISRFSVAMGINVNSQMHLKRCDISSTTDHMIFFPPPSSFGDTISNQNLEVGRVRNKSIPTQ